MLTMLGNDLLHHPTGQISKSTLTKIKSDGNIDRFEALSEEEMLYVCLSKQFTMHYVLVST